MDILKKHLISILCAVFCLVAIVLSFVPLGGFLSTLKTDAEKRKEPEQKAAALLGKERLTPEMDLINTTQPIKLDRFPSRAVIDQIQGYLTKLTRQAGEVFDTAKKINRDEFAVKPAIGNGPPVMLIVPNSLPEPKGESEIEFKKQLQLELTRLRIEVLKAGYPPTAEDYKKAEDAIVAEMEKLKVKDATGVVVNETEVANATAREKAKVPEKLNKEVADKARVYMAPTVMPSFPEITGPNVPVLTPEKIYFTQAAVWVLEDACRVLAEVNSKAKSITESPIKQIREINIAVGPGMYYRPNIADPSGATGDPAAVVAVTSMDGRGGGGGGGMVDTTGVPHSQDPFRSVDATVTGRLSNAMYDVITFTITMDVDQRYITKIIKQFSTNRFMTVRKVDYVRMDTNSVTRENFVYGAVPVAQIKLDIEVLQMRDWTAAYMPRTVKDILIGAGKEYEAPLTEKKTEDPAAPAKTVGSAN